MSMILETNENEQYIIVDELGSGCSCECYGGYLSTDESKKLYAIKLFEEQRKNYYEKEIEIYKQINSNYTLQVYNHGVGYVLYNNNENPAINNDDKKIAYYIILELAENGELFDYIYYLKRPFSEKISSKIFLSIVKSIEYLHKKNIAHCDIKLENILVTKNFDLKLIDFSFSQKCEENNLIYVSQGTETYCSPESERPSRGYDPFKHDMFSLGVVLFILTVGRFPFQNANFFDKHYRHIEEKDFNGFWLDFEKYRISDECKDLFNKLVCYEPKERIGFEEIMEHPWIKQYNDNIENKGDIRENEKDEDIVEELSKRKEEMNEMN